MQFSNDASPRTLSATDELYLVAFQAFRTKGDGRYIMFGAGNNKQFKEFCQASVTLLTC